MSRGGVAAILVSVVMVMVGAVPIMAGTYEVVKGSQGPNASAVTWVYVAQDYGIWKASILNNGLKSLTIDVYDNTTGVPQEIMHQRIRFAAYNAYPMGEVETQSVIVAAGRIYVIIATPSGPRGASCTITDSYPPPPPVAMFTTTLSRLDASFDASGSHDPHGTIVSYDWDFGDGTVGSGRIVSHTFPGLGTYTVTLTVANEKGVTSSTSQSITISDMPPTASFTCLVEGYTVHVDASGSSDDYGIVSYEWDWGDGTKGTGVTASHTYAIPEGTASQVLPVGVDTGKIPPYMVFGQTTDSYGAVLPNCYVKVTNLRTGAFCPTVSDPEYGFYQVDAYFLPGTIAGDLIEVIASKDAWYGKNQGVVDWAQAYLWLDVKLDQMIPQPFFTITLKTTDTVNQVDTTNQTVILGRSLQAEFWYWTTYLVATFDASLSSGPTSIVSYTWDWGDMSPIQTTISPVCSHAYSAYGTYTVTLTVTDTAGSTSSVTTPVYVESPGPP